MAPPILIVGCGAIGSLFAAALSKVAGVTAYDSNAEHMRAIASQGLRVTGNNPRVARFKAASDAAALKDARFDAIIFLIKSKATTGALAALRSHIAGNPLLVTLQNGMGN